MNIKAENIKKINFFSSLPIKFCEKILGVTKVYECDPDTVLYNEGDRGDTMMLIFQGEVEVSKNMAVKTTSGFMVSQKPIIRLQTSDPEPEKPSLSESTVSIVKSPAFGIGEFSLVLDDAIRTANVITTTNVKYGIIKLEDFTKIVINNPEIGGKVYFEVAKSAVNNLAIASQDISNLTQAFFYAITR